jgi:predicted RNA-binding Zn-ribbon protein involved in translation (DUF1610 family)
MNDGKNGINRDPKTKEKTGSKGPIFYYEDNIKEPPIAPPSLNIYNNTKRSVSFTCPRCGSTKSKIRKYISYKDIMPRRRTRYTCRKCTYEEIH